MISVELTQDPGRLARIIPQWEDLATRAIEPNPMYEHWMLLPAFRFCGEAEKLCCALVWMRDSQRADAAPTLAGLFVFQRVPRFRGLPATALRSWAHVSWMLCTPLVRADKARPCVAALLDWLEDGGDASSAFEFRFLPSDGAFHGVLADALRERRSTGISTSNFTRAFLRKGRDADSYLDSAASTAGRKSMRRKEKRLAECGVLRHVAMQPGCDAGRWIDDFLRLEASGWKGRQGTALASSRNALLFAHEALSAAHCRNRLQMVGVDLDGSPIARCCNITAGEAGYAYRTAYDEQFSHYSPGVMAEMDSIRHFHSDPGLQWMDSLTDPDNITLNRLWKERRTMQTVVVGTGAWGDLWVSMLPVMRWARNRVVASVLARSAQ